jgi:N-acetylmuramoyl-L-alanine amidase
LVSIARQIGLTIKWLAGLPLSKIQPVCLRLVRVFFGIAFATLLGSCAQAPKPGAGAGRFSTVVIDAGHGGKDSGGISGRRAPVFLREKDMTLDTAKRIRAILRRAGLRTIMVRDDDHFVELDDRVAFANRQGPGAILISIHYDAVGNSGPNGAKTFFWRADSHGLATRIQAHLVAKTGEANIGVLRRRLRLTRNPDIPCVLCECAYLTNPAEAAKVADEKYRQRIAEGVAEGIVEQRRLGDAGIAPVPEIWAPLSKASDRYQGGSRSSRHHRKASRRLH